jgi:hypothetical protein
MLYRKSGADADFLAGGLHLATRLARMGTLVNHERVGGVSLNPASIELVLCYVELSASFPFPA